MRWIVIDGIDGSGKSTHARWATEHYKAQGEKVLLRMHPSERWMGKLTRRALEGRGKLMRLLATTFFIIDVLSSVASLKKDDRKYGTIIYVRYLMGAAYLPDRYIETGYDFFARLLPVPKRLLLIDINPEIAVRRISMRMERTEMFEDMASLGKTREKMKRLAKGSWHIIDNSVSNDEARAALMGILEKWDSSPPSDQ